MARSIKIRGARVNNLQGVDIDIPKDRIVVFTGVSGSGKSSLVFDTIAAESRRLLNDTLPAFVQNFLPHYAQPDAELIDDLSAAIVIDQARIGGNPRSTMGTYTDTYTLLRVLFSRMGAPSAGAPIRYSFNDPRGMCQTCEGLGRVSAIDEDLLVDPNLSLADGAITFTGYKVGSWPWGGYAKAGLFDVDKPVRDYTPAERHDLLHGEERKIKVDMGEVGSMNITYMGLVTKLRKSVLSKELDQLQPHVRADVERISAQRPCETCGGARINEAARATRIDGTGIADCAAMEVTQLREWLASVDDASVAPLVESLVAKLGHLELLGLGYLSLDRPTATLSGGESQRVRMVRYLGSSLTDMTYVLDEPSIGLHPHDVHRLNGLLRRLRDKGNSVLVVEHEPEVIAIADHAIELGPGAGSNGGRVVFEGTPEELRASATRTGEQLARHAAKLREPRGWSEAVRIEGATRHNLRDVSVDVPLGVLVTVTGVAGSGKSSLIHGYLPGLRPDAVVVDQGLSSGSRRSNPATYTGMLDKVRAAFAKANGVKPSLFSANSEGACPDCNGLGVTYTDLGHMEGVTTVCETCEGRRFTEAVLEHRLRGLSIADVFDMTAAEAVEAFTERPIRERAQALVDVGLSYVTLGQPVSTLSGGERQRLKLATQLDQSAALLVLDEPTTGLHMDDVQRLVDLFHSLVDRGSSVVVIEHDLDVVAQSDWVIDMGPGAGRGGGTVVFSGTPQQLTQEDGSLTGRYLRDRLAAAVRA